MHDFQNSLPDSDARECAQNDLSTTYFVEAAAGTGKTTLLVSRILTIVKETLVPLARVAAITFTEKAAAELKQKLRRKLEQDAQCDDEGGERCRIALGDLDVMPMGTIHSFCRDILRQRPVEAQVDPEFQMLDEAGARALQDEIWQRFIADEFSGDCAAALPFMEMGLREDAQEGRGVTLRTLFDTLLQYREDIDELHVKAPAQEDLQHQISALRQALSEHAAASAGCTDSDDKLVKVIQRELGWFADCPWEDPTALLRQLSHYKKPNGNHKGLAPNWDAEARAQARAFFHGELTDRVTQLSQGLFSAIAAPLIVWLKTAVRQYQLAKRTQGTVDFHDLLLLTRNLLRDHPEARDYFKARYDYLLVDEFQDTDPLQAEIVFFLGERTGEASAAWETVQLDEGKLFIVGDPKQSIYRFRRADLDLYGRVKRRIEDTGQCLNIFVNFRSAASLIHEVNSVFAPLMTGGDAEFYEPDYVAMEPAVSEPDCARVELLPPPDHFSREVSSAALSRAEAACIAEYIRELAARTPAQINSFSDIAILYLSGKALTELEEALRAREIPYRVSGGRDLPKRSEIMALRTVLAAVVNPYDAGSVVGALRSPFFACADDELLRHKLATGNFNYLSADSPEEHIRRSFSVLRKCHASQCRVPPAEIIGMIFDETAGLSLFALKPQGENRIANLLRIQEMAGSLEQAEGFSLYRMLQWLDKLEDFRLGEEYSLGEEREGGAVQLMTVHKAKGLEFPTVILYDLATNQSKNQPYVILRRPQNTVEMRAVNCQTPGFAEAAQQDQQRAYHELMRLLYVAMTRAKQSLVIPAYWSKAGQISDGQWALLFLAARYPPARTPPGSGESTGYLWHDTNGYDLRTPPQEHLILDIAGMTDPPPVATEVPWESARNRAAAGLLRAQLFRRPSDHEARLFPTTGRGVSPHQAAAFGRFVHRVMEMITLPDGPDLDEAIPQASVEFSIPAAAAQAGQEMIRRLLNASELQHRFMAAERIYRELGFTAVLDGRIVEGTIDMVLQQKDRLTIVDFKTDQIRPEQAAARAGDYRPQLQAYAEALEALTKKPVTELVLCFLRPGVTISLPR